MGEMVPVGLFWGALSLLVYTYLGYPLLLALVGGRRASVSTTAASANSDGGSGCL